MTANAFAEDRQKALEVGMNEHVAKPIDMNKLLPVLSFFLSHTTEDYSNHYGVCMLNGIG